MKPAPSIKRTANEYLRGVIGGLLFSLPVLMTMEVWWRGFNIPPSSLLIVVISTFSLLLGYNLHAGMRPDTNFREIVYDSFSELGLGLIISFFFLWMIGVFNPFATPVIEILGQVIMESVAVAIGVSIGTARFGQSHNKKEQQQESSKAKKGVFNWSHVVLSICGAILIGMPIAPTQELVMIATRVNPGQVLAMVLFSLLITAVVLYFSEFHGTKEIKDNVFLHAVKGISLAYALALLTALFLVWMFGHTDTLQFRHVVFVVVIQGILTSIGASAGRLLIK